MSNSLDPVGSDHTSGLIWFKTASKVYQQTALAGIELISFLTVVCVWYLNIIKKNMPMPCVNNEGTDQTALYPNINSLSSNLNKNRLLLLSAEIF